MDNSKNSVVVTGSSSGLGRAIAGELTRKGFRVIGVSRSAPDRELANNSAYFHIKGDLSCSDIRKDLLTAAKAAGSLHSLVNCAGVGYFSAPGEMKPTEVHEIINTNLLSLILVTELLFQTIERNSGTIVNISSVAGVQARKDESIYCASKWGVTGYTRALKEYCKQHNGVRVIGVYPSGMRTSFWKPEGLNFARSAGFPKPQSLAKQIAEIIESDPSESVSSLTIEW